MSFEHLYLMDWRRTVFRMYLHVREAGRGEANLLDAAQEFRTQRDKLFRDHPSSPLSVEQRSHFQSLPYFDYNPVWRIVARFQPIQAGARLEIPVGDDGVLDAKAIGTLKFEILSRQAELSVYWLQGYGGGLWLPFGDATSSKTTYGGGRYLYDTIKGADLGVENETLLLDFNYAYNPSCAYNSKWVCPLTPAQNRLPFAVEAGERISEVGSVTA